MLIVGLPAGHTDSAVSALLMCPLRLDRRRPDPPLRRPQVADHFGEHVPAGLFKGLGFRVYKGLQGLTRVYKGLQGLTRVYKGLQGLTRVYKGVQGFTRVYEGVRGCTRV